jgi:hypothetical protein
MQSCRVVVRSRCFEIAHRMFNGPRTIFDLAFRTRTRTRTRTRPARVEYEYHFVEYDYLFRLPCQLVWNGVDLREICSGSRVDFQ